MLVVYPHFEVNLLCSDIHKTSHRWIMITLKIKVKHVHYKYAPTGNNLNICMWTHKDTNSNFGMIS